MVNVKSNDSNLGAVLVSSKALLDTDEMKDYEQDNCSVKNGLFPGEYYQKQEVLSSRSTNLEQEKIIRAEAQNSTGKILSSPLKTESVLAVIDSDSSEPMTIPTGGKKQTSHTGHSNGSEINDSSLHFSPQYNRVPSPKAVEKPEKNLSSVPTKQLHSHYRKYYDEEDTWSLASSTATTKSKVTVPVAPKFTCVNRMERRKEYYTKLEEKHRALEKEKLEYQARTKEEEAAAIKQLRKSMMYKANPVPSFYREGPPPKPELKKLPVTRAKSPNLSRRKSCGDAVKLSPDEKGLVGRGGRHSVGSYKEGRSSLVGSKGKDRVGARKSCETNKVKVCPKVPVETSGNCKS